MHPAGHPQGAHPVHALASQLPRPFQRQLPTGIGVEIPPRGARGHLVMGVANPEGRPHTTPMEMIPRGATPIDNSRGRSPH